MNGGFTQEVKRCKECKRLFQKRVFGPSPSYCSNYCSARHYVRTHRDLYRKWCRKDYAKNRRKYCEQKRAYYQTHLPQMRRRIRKWYYNNRIKAVRCSRRYYREHRKECCLRQLAISERRRCLLMKARGSHTLDEWLALKRFYKKTCPACGRKEPRIKLHKDHIKPLTKGGSNFIRNIQPLCCSCNTSKGTTTIKY